MNYSHNSFFNKGMNQDLSESMPVDNYYFEMLNGSIITDKGLNSGNPSTIPGNKLLFSIPDTSSVHIITGESTNFDLVINGISENITLSYSSKIEFFKLLKNHIDSSLGYAVHKIRTAYNSDNFYIFSDIPGLINISLTNNDPSNSVYFSNTINPVTGLLPIGWCEIRSSIYIITTNDKSSNPSSLTQIWKVDYDKNTLNSSIKLLYNNYLNTSLYYPIANPGMIIGRYEHKELIKLYFTDNYNTPRYCNLADPNLFAVQPNIMNINPLINGSTPVLEEIIQSGGSLLAGAHSVCYRLKNSSGSETVSSATSGVVYLTDKSDSGNLIRFDGTISDTNTNKSLKFRIDNLDNNYNIIEILHIYKKSKDSTPIIKSVITSNYINYFDFILTGNEEAIELSIKELNFRNVNFTRVGTIASKEDYLFYGDVSLENSDVNYDARAFRYKHPSLKLPSETGTYPVGVLPDTNDDINPRQGFEYFKSGPAYIYQKQNNPSDPLVFGGSGTNISYKFITKSLLIDNHFDRNTLSSNVISMDGGLTQPSSISSYPTIGPYEGTSTPYRDIPKINSTYNFNVKNNSNLIVHNNKSFTDYTSSYISSDSKGYLRDEVYAFGIVFFDKQYNPGFVKWIGDIQFPHVFMPDKADSTKNTIYPHNTDRIHTYPIVSIGLNLAEAYANIMGIKFDINIPLQFKDKIQGFMIVRCERKNTDKTILGQGALNPVHYYNNTSHLCTVHALNRFYPVFGQMCTFTSPDFLFQGYPGYSNSDYIDIVSQLSPAWIGYPTDQAGNSLNAGDHTVIKNYISEYNLKLVSNRVNPNIFRPYFILENTLSIDKTYLEDGGSSISYFNNLAFRNNSFDGRGAGNKTLLLKGEYTNISYDGDNNIINYPNFYSFGVFSSDVMTPSGSLTGTPNPYWSLHEDELIDDSNTVMNFKPCGHYLANYKIKNNNQYGGSHLTERVNREYIQCSDFYKLSDSEYGSIVSIDVYGGDTYVNVFDYVSAFRNYTQSGKSSTVRLFPTESSTNIAMRENFDESASDPTTLMVPNREQFPEASDHIALNQSEFFSYNNVYSSDNNSKIYIPKNNLSPNIFDYDVRVYRSEPKINGELIDSWSIIKQNNYIDIDSQYSKLYLLILLNNELLFFQKDAFGLLSVNEKSIIQDKTGSDIVLGIGGVIDRFDYKSEKIGTKHKFGISKGLDSLIFYHHNTNSFYKYSEKLQDFSGLSGFHNINTNNMLDKDNPYLSQGITAGYDFLFKQYYYTVLGNTVVSELENNGFTLSYNDIINNYHSFYSFKPCVYINDNNNLITFEPLSNSAYIHNKGKMSEFYGNIYPFEITTLVNPFINTEKIFDNFIIDVENYTYNAKNSIFSISNNSTLSSFQVWNDYQNTNTVPLINDVTYKKIKRNYNINIGGSRVLDSNNDIFLSSNLYSYPNRHDITQRIKSNYIFAKFTYNNLQNYKLSIKNMSTLFRINLI